MTTKEKIIFESLKLFSVSGFSAVSVRAIAAQVGVRDSALYKHFSSKQAIFDAIVEESKIRMMNQYKAVDITHITWEDMEKMCSGMYRFQTQNEWISMFRKMLLIEQFKNEEAAKTYKEFFIDMPINGQTQIFKKLISEGIMKDHDARVMSVELYAPFFMYHAVEDDPEVLQKMFATHVKNFIAWNRV